MDLDQITGPPENTQAKCFFEGDGLLWFVETSWHYVAPRGPWEVLQFLARLPAATWRYRKAMANGR